MVSSGPARDLPLEREQRPTSRVTPRTPEAELRATHLVNLAGFVRFGDGTNLRAIVFGGLLILCAVCAFAIMPSAKPSPNPAATDRLTSMAGCAEQTWPYLDAKCLGDRNVRVLPPATVAKTTIMVIPTPATNHGLAAQQPAPPVATVSSRTNT